MENELEIKAEQIAKVELGATGVEQYVDTPFGLAKAFRAFKDLPKKLAIVGNLRIEITRRDDGLIDKISITPLAEIEIKVAPEPISTKQQNEIVKPDAGNNTHLVGSVAENLVLNNREYVVAMLGEDRYFTSSELVNLLLKNPLIKEKIPKQWFQPSTNGRDRIYNNMSLVLPKLTAKGYLERATDKRIIDGGGIAYQYRFKPRPKTNYMQEDFKLLQDTLH